MDRTASGGSAGGSLAEALFGRRAPHEPEPVWQDREVRFDLGAGELACRRGEEVLDFMGDVEDTKGNNGEPGELTVTNLRLTWARRRSRRTNISVGLDCITDIRLKPAASRLKGDVAALFVLTRSGAQRYEFVFTALAPGSGGPELLAVVQGVSQAYEASRLYRELKLRGAVIADDELRLLPSEQAYSKVNGVVNLSSDQGSTGVLYITSVRLVWHSAANQGFNLSLPYLQIKSLRVSESRVGPCLVVETTPRAGGYVLGFKVEPKETLDYVHKEVSSLWQAYSQSSVFGLHYDPSSVRREALAEGQAAADAASIDEDVAILDEGGPRSDAWAAAAYGAGEGGCAGCGGGAGGGEPRQPVFCPELGLAVEAPQDPSTTVAQLWSVL